MADRRPATVSRPAADSWPACRFAEFLVPNKRPYLLGPAEDANLVGMHLYGLGPFHREFKPANKIAKKSHFVIRTGDVIYNKLFAWKGSLGIVPPELDGMFVSDKFPTYELDKDKVDPMFLAWYFRYPGLWDQARRMSKGSAALSKLTLNPPRFMDLTLRVPPLDVQRDVARRLETFSAKLERAQRTREFLDAEATALLMAVLEDTFDRLRKKHSVALVSEVVDSTRGISYGVVQTGPPHDGGIPTLRAGDLPRQFEVSLANVKRVDPAVESQYRRTRLRGGEVLLRIRGGLGEVAVCPQKMVGGNVSREIAVIPLDERLDPTFVMYSLAAPGVQSFLRANLRGTSYVGINLKDVRRVELPVPPLNVQESTVRRLNDLRRRVESVARVQREAGNSMGALLPSLVSQSFA